MVSFYLTGSAFFISNLISFHFFNANSQKSALREGQIQWQVFFGSFSNAIYFAFYFFTANTRTSAFRGEFIHRQVFSSSLLFSISLIVH